jgi:hypothetical protein
MTIDIETITRRLMFSDKNEGQIIPYLICGYYKVNNVGKKIFSYSYESDNESVNNMMRDFITQLIGIKHIKYVYAHNFSAFDGIFFY